jgi:hypothetical protein
VHTLGRSNTRYHRCLPFAWVVEGGDGRESFRPPFGWGGESGYTWSFRSREGMMEGWGDIEIRCVSGQERGDGEGWASGAGYVGEKRSAAVLKVEWRFWKTRERERRMMTMCMGMW